MSTHAGIIASLLAARQQAWGIPAGDPAPLPICALEDSEIRDRADAVGRGAVAVTLQLEGYGTVSSENLESLNCPACGTP